jgi:hypothetical protein
MALIIMRKRVVLSAGRYRPVVKGEKGGGGNDRNHTLSLTIIGKVKAIS